jgi:hypothetical protein
MITKEELRKEFEKKFKDEITDISTNKYSDWLEQKLIDQEPKQREVSEELKYQNLTCLINGFELNSYQKSLARKEFNRLISIKQINK